MKGKKLVKAAAAALLALTVAFCMPAGACAPAAAASLDEMQDKKTELEAEQEKIDAELARLKDDKDNQTAYVESLNEKISNTEAQIDTLNSQINALDDSIVQMQSDIAGKQAEIDDNYAKLKQRVYALYLTGEASTLEIILNAKNIMDLSDKAELMRTITEHDTSLINTIKDEMNAIAEQKAAIEEQRTQAASARAEVDEQRQALKEQQAEASAALDALSASEQAELAAKNQNAAEQTENSAAIDQWYADYYAELKRQEEEGQQQSSTPQGSGTFMWPVPSYICISQVYGSYDMGSFHKGVDIAASYGSPIVAADSGTVIASVRQDYYGTYGGYGNVVVIDHGSGLTTLYAHMSSRAVSEGDYVAKGQVIGYVGSTGQSTGNHCHFEVRQYGSAVNPMSYF